MATTRPLLTSLYVRVLCGVVCGVALGIAAPSFAAKLQPLGDGFIRLVKMTVGPLIFCTVSGGIANMTSSAGVGKTGGLALIYFEIASTVALVIGLVVVNIVSPGAGMNADPSKLPGEAAAKLLGNSHKTATQFLLDIIPDTLFGALARGELLPVLLVALLVGFALRAMGPRGAPVAELIDRLGHVIFAVIDFVMKLAPIGAFGAMAYTVGQFGVQTLGSLASVLACFYATCVVFVFGVLGLVARLHGFSIFKFVRYIREELFIVLGTSSSESVLPRMMEKLERLGVGNQTVGLVVPTGYSFNLDGTAIYVTMASVFIAKATNAPFGFGDQLALLAVALVTSKGAAGVTGSGFVTLAATIDMAATLPASGLRLIAGIDRFMSEARALTNVIGNGVATIVVARWVRDVNVAKLRDELDRRMP